MMYVHVHMFLCRGDLLGRNGMVQVCPYDILCMPLLLQLNTCISSLELFVELITLELRVTAIGQFQ